ncbi:MAG: hypothetical protein ACJAYU_003923 [Bradymonadia bacterium]
MTTRPADHIEREGVACTVCHQITAKGLGTPESFVGEFVIGESRESFGPHANPFTNPILSHVDYRPTEAAHVMQSALCASCHTLITDTLDAAGVATGDRFPE